MYIICVLKEKFAMGELYLFFTLNSAIKEEWILSLTWLFLEALAFWQDLIKD